MCKKKSALQGRQRDPSVKTLRSPLSADVDWQNSTPLRACPRHQSEEMEI